MSIEQGNLIFSTIAGSHLYGLAHEESDLDVYEVYEGKSPKLRQSIAGDDDRVRGTLDAFLTRAYTGSHQSVEALFSREKVYAPGMEEKYGSFLDGIYIGGGDVYAKYERTIKKFSFGDFKKRRHACRLALNLHDLRKYGRFDPTLTPLAASLCAGYAKTLKGKALIEQLDISDYVW